MSSNSPHDAREWDAAAADTMTLKRKLDDAITADAITAAFQPIVVLRSRTLAGFEALARWRDPELGEIGPALFIPLAEQQGLLDRLTAQLIRRACMEASQWDPLGPKYFTLSFNISPSQLQSPHLPELIAEAVAPSGFPLRRIRIEITETALLEDVLTAQATVARLKAMGMGLVLDDFGTGFASLTRLQALPFDTIKVDASFVCSMVEQRESRKIVAAMVGLGQSLGLPVVAEGVETEAQAKMLETLGCDLGQGWLFGAGLPAAEVPAVLAAMAVQAASPKPMDVSLSQRAAHLEAIYAGTSVGLCFIDRDLRYVSVNENYARRLHRTAAETVGQTVQELRPDIVDLVRANFAQAVSGARIAETQYRMRCMNRPALVTVSPAYDEAGEVIGLSITVIDIDERRTLIAPLLRLFRRRGRLATR